MDRSSKEDILKVLNFHLDKLLERSSKMKYPEEYEIGCVNGAIDILEILIHEIGN